MAGSLCHIVDDETGEFTMDNIDNLGDAHEALEECYYIIAEMSAGRKSRINKMCRRLRYPKLKVNIHRKRK